MAEFVRLAEVVHKKKDMRVVGVTVVPTIADCSGRIWFTDIQLQEGPNLTGYAPHTETCLQKFRENGTVKAPVWFNGIVRSEETVILFNLGKTSTPLDIHIYPKSDMAAGTVRLAQGVGGQRAVFPEAVNAGDDVALLASTRECTRNGNPERGILPVQRRMGFKAHRIPAAGEIRAAFVFNAGNGRRDFSVLVG